MYLISSFPTFKVASTAIFLLPSATVGNLTIEPSLATKFVSADTHVMVKPLIDSIVEINSTSSVTT